MTSDAIRQAVACYYTERLEKHGTVPAGVDWPSAESQELRFAQLTKILDDNVQNVQSIKPAQKVQFSLNDYGCGYGALFDYLMRHNYQFSYTGFDWSGSMIESALRLYGSSKNAAFVQADTLKYIADYTIASGIFNVKLKESLEAWHEHVINTLHELNEISTKGFAFNMLTKYSDEHLMRDDLYYGDPCLFFDYCKKQFAKNIALLHDYNLYEFTILVRK